jgi:hypothetical protein
MPLWAARIVVGQDNASSGPDFRGLRIRRIRTRRAEGYSVTAGRSSRSVHLSKEFPTRSWLRASTKPPLMGFYATLIGFPFNATLALQSIKEPRDRRISFETHHPS